MHAIIKKGRRCKVADRCRHGCDPRYCVVCGAERSEAPSALDTTKDKWYHPGAALSSRCPREGSMLLESKEGKRIIVNTTCNSWRCTSCRDKNRARFKAVVASGISNLANSAFITITYKADSQRLLVAGCVARDWKALFRALKKSDPWIVSLPKMRIMELTKRGTPHFHLVIGNIPEERRIRCFGRSLNIDDYRRRFDDCLCVAHCIARAWARVQGGESYIVHSMPVSSAMGAAVYLSKYLDKGFDAERGERLGMKRRWSTSRNWPSEARSRLKESGRGWRRTQWASHQVIESELEMDTELLERRETEKQKEARKVSSAKRLLRVAERFKYD